VKSLVTGLAMGESPRWHGDRLWVADWGAQEIVAVDPDGKSEVMVRVPFGLPFCIDWLPDGRLLIVSEREGLLLRTERDGSLVTHADLRGLSEKGWNEVVVDGRGNAYINGGPGIALLTASSGLRYWVASGATVVAHATAHDFLQSVIDRRWTLAPDFLEQHRKNAKFKFRGVDSRYDLANGALTLHPIDGIGSEGALLAFLPSDRVLWASGFIFGHVGREDRHAHCAHMSDFHFVAIHAIARHVAGAFEIMRGME